MLILSADGDFHPLALLLNFGIVVVIMTLCSIPVFTAYRRDPQHVPALDRLVIKSYFGVVLVTAVALFIAGGNPAWMLIGLAFFCVWVFPVILSAVWLARRLLWATTDTAKHA